VLKRVVESLAKSHLPDFDALLSMLFQKNPGNPSVSKQQFQDFLLYDMKIAGLTEKDVKIFMQTDSILRELSFFTRQDLKRVLEEPFNRAIQGLVDSEAHTSQRWGTEALRDATFQMQHNESFGLRSHPKHANDPHWLTNRRESSDFERDHHADLGMTTHKHDYAVVSEELERLLKDRVFDVILQY
jgi:hypothetical protein